MHKTANALPAGLDPGMAREGLTLFRSLPLDAEREVLLCTDLHAGNILAAEREPWLLIDPKPYVGDPTYDALQHMLNCDRRLYDDPRGLTRRLANLLDLDADRLLLCCSRGAYRNHPNGLNWPRSPSWWRPNSRTPHGTSRGPWRTVGRHRAGMVHQ